MDNTPRNKDETYRHPLKMPIISNANNPPTPHWMLIGYEGGINNAICESGNARAVSVTVAYIAPEAPKLGRISGTVLFAAVVAAAPDVAETAAAQVSTFFELCA